MKKLFFPLVFTISCIACATEHKIGGEDPGTNITPPENSDVTIYVTTSNRSFDLTKTTATFSTKSNMSPNTIYLKPEQIYQVIDGFGAAITGSSAYNLMNMPQAQRTQFLTETFDAVNGFGFSYIRVSIGCSDFSLSEFTCCDTPGIENFALQSEDIEYVIPVLQEIVRINPNIKIMGSPWTCPLWMKVNNNNEKQPYNSWTGGHLNSNYYQDYATYFVKWIKAFAEYGIPIYSLTPQNEPRHDGNSASLLMDWQEASDFVHTALAPQLRSAGLENVKIYCLDHNYSLYQYPIDIYNSGTAKNDFAGAAFHNYGGSSNNMLNVVALHPDKELVFTEASIGVWNDGRNLAKMLTSEMENLGLATVNNYCRGIILWNLMLDTGGRPFRPKGCSTCYGVVDIDAMNYTKITRNCHYYLLAHFSTVVKPEAVRIGTSGSPSSGLVWSAFKNTDDSYAVVLMNKNSSTQKITLDDGVHHFTYDVPAMSVVSYKW